jgi:hypothetical protein
MLIQLLHHLLAFLVMAIFSAFAANAFARVLALHFESARLLALRERFGAAFG